MPKFDRFRDEDWPILPHQAPESYHDDFNPGEQQDTSPDASFNATDAKKANDGVETEQPGL